MSTWTHSMDPIQGNSVLFGDYSWFLLDHANSHQGTHRRCWECFVAIFCQIPQCILLYRYWKFDLEWDIMLLIKKGNTRCHTVQIAHLQRQHVDVLPWPAQSPDISLSPSLYFSKNISGMCWITASDIGQLEPSLDQDWNAKPQVQVQSLIQLIQHQCVTVRDSNGGQTFYWLCDFILWPFYNLWPFQLWHYQIVLYIHFVCMKCYFLFITELIKSID